MSEKPLATIRINIHTRRDGTIYISSEDMTHFSRMLAAKNTPI